MKYYQEWDFLYFYINKNTKMDINVNYLKSCEELEGNAPFCEKNQFDKYKDKRRSSITLYDFNEMCIKDNDKYKFTEQDDRDIVNSDSNIVDKYEQLYGIKLGVEEKYLNDEQKDVLCRLLEARISKYEGPTESKVKFNPLKEKLTDKYLKSCEELEGNAPFCEKKPWYLGGGYKDLRKDIDQNKDNYINIYNNICLNKDEKDSNLAYSAISLYNKIYNIKQ